MHYYGNIESIIHTDRSKAVLLIWFSVFACFGVGFCTVFTLCVLR